MKTTSIALIVVIVAVVLVIIIYPANQEGGDSSVSLPQIIDEVQLDEDTSVDIEVVDESPQEEMVLIKNENGPDYWIDENGMKHYVLDIADSPGFG